MYVGSSSGARDIHNSGALYTTSHTVTGLPTTGGQVHVRLWYNTGSWAYVDVQYTAYNSTSSNTSCPCFTEEQLDALYDQLVAGQGKTVADCMEGDYSSSEGYPPYTYYYVEACVGPYQSCDYPSHLEAGVSASHPYIGGSRAEHTWNASCYVHDSLNDRYILYDANLNHREVEACSNVFKTSKWAQDVTCQ
jgi:hypothetical protein